MKQRGGVVWLSTMDHLSVPFYQVYSDNTKSVWSRRIYRRGCYWDTTIIVHISQKVQVGDARRRTIEDEDGDSYNEPSLMASFDLVNCVNRPHSAG